MPRGNSVSDARDSRRVSEARIKSLIFREFGARADCMLWNQPTGRAVALDDQVLAFAQKHGKRIISFGMPGLADVGMIHAVKIKSEHVGLTVGVAVQIETKTATGRQSEQQKRFQSAVERRGAPYILARCNEDVSRRLELAAAGVILPCAQGELI